MLRRGEVSINEAAQIALVSRQRVRQWCLNAGIDPRAAREAWIARILQSLNKQDREK